MLWNIKTDKCNRLWKYNNSTEWYKKTQIDKDKQNTLENDTDQENILEEDTEDSPLTIIDENSNVNSPIKESILSVLKETATKGMPVDNIDISTESPILHDVENSTQDTGLLNETSVNNDSEKIISSGDEKTETDVSNITDVTNINLPKNV